MKCQITQSNPACKSPISLVSDPDKPSFSHLGLIFKLISLCLLYLLPSALYAGVRINSAQFEVTMDSATHQLSIADPGSIAIEIERSAESPEFTNFELTITNISETALNLQPLELYAGENLSALIDTEAGLGASFYSYLEPFIADRGQTAQRFTDLDELPSITTGAWFGWTNRYHVDAVRLATDRETLSFKITAESEPLVQNEVSLRIKPMIDNLAPGESISLEFAYLSAIKSRQLLQDSSINLEGLLLSNLWDWLRALCFLFWGLLDYLYVMTGNWGFSIILMALIIRILIIPVTRFSLEYQKRAIQQQARIAPLLAEVKHNYKGAEQSEKILALYESQKYDQLAPFKSMLGLFIQIPIFVALFNVLGESYEVSGQSFLWINDLAISDRLFSTGINLPYFGSYFNLLPFVMAAITVLSTWLAGRSTTDADTPTLSLFGMAGVFFVLFYSFPAALVLYWLSSNLFQLIQQTIENRLKSEE